MRERNSVVLPQHLAWLMLRVWISRHRNGHFIHSPCRPWIMVGNSGHDSGGCVSNATSTTNIFQLTTMSFISEVRALSFSIAELVLCYARSIWTHEIITILTIWKISMTKYRTENMNIGAIYLGKWKTFNGETIARDQMCYAQGIVEKFNYALKLDDIFGTFDCHKINS